MSTIISPRLRLILLASALGGVASSLQHFRKRRREKKKQQQHQRRPQIHVTVIKKDCEEGEAPPRDQLKLKEERPISRLVWGNALIKKHMHGQKMKQ